MQDFIDKSIQEIKDIVQDSKAIVALSGGVDSAVAALLVYQAIGRNLKCIFVDHGLLRKNEREEVERVFAQQFEMDLIVVDAKDRFFKELKGVSDPEAKRKIIGEGFIRVFEEVQSQLTGYDFLVQGTIKSDLVESGKDGGQLVKSHHNVGGLPEEMNFSLIEPLKDLYKPQVREVGRALGLPDTIVDRQPFPGPGLGVRCLGLVTEEKVDILREADHIFTSELEKAGYGDQVWQYFAAIPDFKVVGMVDGQRAYSYPIFLRAVSSDDAMEAQASEVPFDLLQAISKKITDQVPQVVRVLYDLTDKPPGTIEFE